jgi:diaminopimelate epimerase
MRFEKWQALGNDYLIFERDGLPFELTPARVRRLCESHFGVGADGVLLLARAADPSRVADLRIFNPDGSEAELSGNGAREAVLYLRRSGWTELDEFAIGTIAGELRPTITGRDTCTVAMGRASTSSKDYPGGSPDGRGELRAGGVTWRFQHVSIGNPQCAIHVDGERELEALDLAALGPSIEGSEQFPNRTNVSFYTPIFSVQAASHDQPRIRARIFERGVGETLASGTGASGAAIAHVLDRRRQAGSPDGGASQLGGAGESAGTAAESVTVALDGGELEVGVGEDLSVQLTGWARPVFAGELSEDFEKELHETE